MSQIGLSFGSGSFSKTSSPAPPIFPAFNASMSAFSSITSPRPMFTMYAPGRIAAISRAPMNFRVCSVSGRVTVM